jgi:hypothetical protein
LDFQIEVYLVVEKHQIQFAMTPQPSHGVNSQVKKDMKPEIIDELDSGRRHTEEPVTLISCAKVQVCMVYLSSNQLKE